MLISYCTNDNSSSADLKQTNQMKQSNVTGKTSNDDVRKMLENKHKMSIENNINTPENYLKLLNTSLKKFIIMKKNIIILILSILASLVGSLLKLKHFKVYGDIFLLIGSISFIYIFIYIVRNRKLY